MGLIDRDKDWNIHFLRDLNVFGSAIVVGSSVAAGALKRREKKRQAGWRESGGKSRAAASIFIVKRILSHYKVPPKNYALLKF